MGSGRSSFWRAALAFFALAAVLVRVVTPPGYMLAAQGAGVVVVLCTGHGPVEAPSPKKDPASSSADAPCLFAALAPLTSPPDAVALPAPFLVTGPAFGATDIVAPGRGLAAPPPWATGPPRLA